MSTINLPALPFKEWTNTRLTTHLILQIIGKTRLKMTPRKNHWWYITLYVTSNGFSTRTIVIKDSINSIEIEFNLRRKAVVIHQSAGEEIVIPLHDGFSVADFYKQYLGELKGIGVDPHLIGKPFDLGIDKPFSEITEYHHYDWKHLDIFWQLMSWNNGIFQEFSGRFYGKTCPVHIYWHHLDLVVTRFSGKKMPPMDKAAAILEKDAYSHEQISSGFWIGDNNMQEPMYYSYTYPAPKGIDEEPLHPSSANWVDSNGSPMALLRYEDVRNSKDPRQAVLDFLESAYQAGAKKAGWKIEEFTVPGLDEL